MPQAGVPGKAGFPKKPEHLKRKRRTIYANEAEYKSLKAHLEELRKVEDLSDHERGMNLTNAFGLE